MAGWRAGVVRVLQGKSEWQLVVGKAGGKSLSVAININGAEKILAD